MQSVRSRHRVIKERGLAQWNSHKFSSHCRLPHFWRCSRLLTILVGNEVCFLNPLTPRKRSALELMTPADSLNNFWFEKGHLPILANLPDFSASLSLDSRLRVVGVEAFSLFVWRLEFEGRSHDMINLFGRNESSVKRIFVCSTNLITVNFDNAVESSGRPWWRTYAVTEMSVKNAKVNVFSRVVSVSLTEPWKESVKRSTVFAVFPYYRCTGSFQTIWLCHATESLV